MSPSDVITKLLDLDPKTGQVVLVGIACLAAGALVVSWGFSSDMLYAAGYVVAFALVARILAFVVSNPGTRRCLGWTFTAAFTCYMIGLVESAVQLTGRLPATPCYLRIFVELPDSCEQRLAPTIEVVGEAAQEPAAHFAFLDDSGAARLWLAQAEPEPAYNDGPVLLKFGGNVTRDQSMALSHELAALGWPVENGNDGGKAVSDAPYRNEIRFYDPASRDAAIRLAHALHELSPDTEIAVRDFSRLKTWGPDGLLEVWLSDLGTNS